jgi:DNA repair protein RadA/Sms
MGRCPDCGAWDALEKHAQPSEPAAPGLAGAWVDGGGGAAGVEARPLPEIEPLGVDRLASGSSELDRVLGGGLVVGSVVLLGGDPGIGKSTLMLQCAGRIALSGRRVLYVSSEESAYQTRLRAERVLPGAGAGLAELLVLSETSLSRVAEQARRVRPALLVIDSVQMIEHGDVAGAPGSVSQLRHCTAELVRIAKVSGVAVALVGHVTKEGRLAGPRVIEHMVDAVLSFEGDRHHAHRVVRAIKNRFGSTMEVGLFEMGGAGLVELDRLGACLAANDPPRPGSIAFPAVHGSRASMVEIQALTATGLLGGARRKATGLDPNRLAVMIAVLEKHGGLRLADQDVFASTVGGWRVVEPANDLALCLAIAGAHLRRALPSATAVVGEVGLGGEIRPVVQLEARAREAARLGYGTILAAPGQRFPGGIGRIEPVKGISEALAALEISPGPAPQRGPHPVAAPVDIDVPERAAARGRGGHEARKSMQ